jgi:hypothetical protein
LLSAEITFRRRKALGQKIAGESAAPIARSVNQVFKTAS